MKKRLLIVVALTLLAVLVLTLVACGGSTEQAPDDSTSTPPSGQTPDNGDGDNEGEITPPENPGGEIAPPENPGGEIAPPENPGGEIGEPEDPKDPDGGEVTDPDEGDEGGDPETPEQPAFAVDTVEKLLEYRSATLYDYLMENYAPTVVTKLAGRSATLDNAEQFEWAVTANDSGSITEMQVRFYYHKSNGGYVFYLGTVTADTQIKIDSILSGTATSSVNVLPVYTASVVESTISDYRPLAEAIITALGETFSPEDTILMAMDNVSTDPDFSAIRCCYVKQITETGVHEYTIGIRATGGDGSLSTLMTNLQANKYKLGNVEKNVVMFETGVTADSVDKALPDSAA